MFEIGKTYRVGVAYYADTVSMDQRPNCRCVDVAMPVVTFSQHGRTWIVNTASPFFFEAWLED
jgi:hypothetical protein